MELIVHGVIMENVSFIITNFLFVCILFKGDLSLGDVKLADVPAWIARRDKTPMGVYQGGVRSKSKRI
jgi:hypothetical protein